MIGNGQGVFLTYIALDTFELWAVKQVIEGTVGFFDTRVVGEVGEPQFAVDACGFRVAGDHRVLLPQLMQLAVRRITRSLLGGQAQILANRQQIEIAADQPRGAVTFKSVQRRRGGLHLLAQVAVVLCGAIKLSVDGHELPAVIEGQVTDQQRRLGCKLTADQVGLGHGQLQALGVLDLEAAEGHQGAAHTAENVTVGHEVGLPGDRLRAARVEVDQPLLQQLELILIATGLGVFIDFLQQHQVRLLVANHPRHLIQAERHVLCGRACIRPAAISQVVPEHITLARQVLHVPGHDLERLPRHQHGGGGGATDGQHFFGFRAPRQAINQARQQRGGQQQTQYGVTQKTWHGVGLLSFKM